MTLASRLHQLQIEMNRAGVSTLVALSGDIHPFQETDPVAAIADVRVIGEAFAVLKADGSRSLVVSPDWEADRARARSGIADTLGCTDIRQHLMRWICRDSRTAIAGLNTVTYATAAWMIETFPENLVYFDKQLKSAAGRKTSSEIARAKRATEIAERGYAELLRLARAGISEIDVASEVCCAMLELGADDNFIMLSASRHNRAVRPPGRHRLEQGDIILCEISPSYDGQFTQICRTAVVGEIPRGFIDKYSLLQEAVHNGMQAARTGATVGAVVAGINANLIAAGYGEFCVPPHMRARGHGLGYGSVAPGDLSAQNGEMLERDMLLVIHPNQYMPETGYMMCGEPVVVTDDGARPLSSRTATLDVAGA